MALVGNNTVLKCDMLVSSTDVPPQMKPWQIARKSIVACASDLAAKGASPTAAMISLGIPAGFNRGLINGLAEGFALASREFGVRIVGGDTNEASELVIDCCMIGEIGTKKIPSRSGGKSGDVVVVSGMFGLSAAGLAILLGGSRPAGAFERMAVKSVLEPAPRQRFGRVMARFLSSSIDSSDGLAISLYELARNSGIDIAVENIPTAEGLEKFATASNLDMNELIFHGGEEYEIVATIPRSKFALAQAAARKSRLGLYVIGSARHGSGRVSLGKTKLENRGYIHFSRR